ncbi:MAG: hypothetical protein KDD22_05970, partial [Bdellovibrionales bacterium]|nr:hypothetical protein [Bdellovibrionales bacterium]
MKIKLTHLSALGMAAIFITLAFQNCSNIEFVSGNALSKTGDITKEGDIVICDPFMKTGSECVGNITGEIYY